MLHKKLGFYGACCAYGALHGYARRSRAPEGDNLYGIACAKMHIYTLFKNRVLTTARDGVKLRLALGDKEC